MQKEQMPARTEILSVAKSVLRRRDSGRIIGIASARGDVRNLLNEYRQYMSETERRLRRYGIRATPKAVELLQSEWSDLLAEHQRPGSLQA
jgi:hypothetical protein